MYDRESEHLTADIGSPMIMFVTQLKDECYTACCDGWSVGGRTRLMVVT